MLRLLNHYKFCLCNRAGLKGDYAYRCRFNKSVFISEKNSYLFVKNEKAGNNTARMTLQTLEAGGALPPWFKSQRRHSGPLLQPSDLALSHPGELNERGFLSFAVVRNPYSRLLSGYLNKIERPGKKQKLFMCRAGLDPNSTASFADFVSAISKQRPVEMDPHWRLQCENLYCDIISYNKIIKLENYDLGFKEITNRIFGRNDLVNVRKGENRRKNIPEHYYTPELTGLVNQVYARDFQQFGYEML